MSPRRFSSSPSSATRDQLASRFGTANLYLGNVIGEFAGELLLNGFFLTSSVALSVGQPRRRWLAVVGIAASAFGWVAMLRNLTPLVAPLATLNNIVLPLWMMTLGLVLAAQGRSGALRGSGAREHDGPRGSAG